MKTSYKARAIFIEFMARDGFGRDESAYEFDEFLTINGKVRVKESYLTMSRIGAKIVTNRVGRTNIYNTFASALNHATF